MSTWIGLLLGSRDSAGALVDEQGQVVARVSVPNASAPADGLAGLVAMTTRLRSRAERLGLGPVGGVGVGFPGVIDPVDGVVRGSRASWRLWTGYPLQQALQDAVDLPATVRNDVVAILVAEQAFGHARGRTDVLVAYASYGVGGAALVHGRIVTGPHGGAGHLGHVPVPGASGRPCSCGGTGHLDAVSSGEAMTEAFRKRAGLTPGQAPYLRVVEEAARNGDPRAVEVLAHGGRALGRALGGLSNVLAPQLIVLAGACMAAPGYRAEVERSLRAETIPGVDPPEVALCVFGGDAQLVGAALAAREAAGGPAADAP
jgi:glucokinase